MANWTILPEAQSELERAYLNYRDRGSERVANEFFEELLDSFRRIDQNPELYAADADGYRQLILHRHSYVIIFRIESHTNIRIVAVSHTSRAPEYWKGR